MIIPKSFVISLLEQSHLFCSLGLSGMEIAYILSSINKKKNLTVILLLLHNKTMLNYEHIKKGYKMSMKGKHVFKSWLEDDRWSQQNSAKKFRRSVKRERDLRMKRQLRAELEESINKTEKGLS